MPPRDTVDDNAKVARAKRSEARQLAKEQHDKELIIPSNGECYSNVFSLNILIQRLQVERKSKQAALRNKRTLKSLSVI